MSKRTPQPAASKQKAVSSKQQMPALDFGHWTLDLLFDIKNLLRIQAFHKTFSLFVIVFRIGRFNDQEEFLAGRQRKPWHVEYGMIRRRQTIKEKHSKHCRE